MREEEGHLDAYLNWDRGLDPVNPVFHGDRASRIDKQLAVVIQASLFNHVLESSESGQAMPSPLSLPSAGLVHGA